VTLDCALLGDRQASHGLVVHDPANAGYGWVVGVVDVARRKLNLDDLTTLENKTR
jgi:hypothetical protein